MRTNLILLIYLFSWSVCAQNSYSDSLINLVNQKNIRQIEEFKLYNLLVEQLRNDALYDQALHYCETWISIAQEKNDYFELTKAYVAEGIIYNNQDNYDEDRASLDAAFIAASQSDNRLAEVYANYLNAYILIGFEDYENALRILQEALKFAEDSMDEFIKAKVYYQFYSIYSLWNDIDNSFFYAKKTVDSAQKSEDPNLISNALAALAVSYTYRYDIDKSNEDLEKIFEIATQNVHLSEKYKNQISNRILAIAELNLASYYLKYYPEKETLIERMAHDAIQTAQKSNGNGLIVANAYGILSDIAQSHRNTVLAKKYLNLAYETLIKEKKQAYYSLIIVCTKLAELTASQNQFEDAFEFQKEAATYSYKLFDENQASISKKLQAQYQFGKQEQEVIQLRERAESERMQKLLYAGLGLIGLLSAFFMFRSYHYKLRFSIERERKLSSEKKEAELQAKYEKEEQAKLRAEQEVMKLQQEKLQNEVMASQLHIQHKNEVLKQLKSTLRNEGSVNIDQILREQSLNDSDFEKAKFRIQEIHPNFFKNLSEKSEKTLTSLDFKYCAYIYLGMDTKQIANLLNVEPKSVRMAKYRLKKKLNLDKATDLDKYLKSVV